MSEDTYPMPKHGWTCFHCGETFINPNLARAHFGVVPSRTPACVLRSERGLLYQLRDVEQERDEWRGRAKALMVGADPDDVVQRIRATRGL